MSTVQLTDDAYPDPHPHHAVGGPNKDVPRLDGVLGAADARDAGRGLDPEDAGAYALAAGRASARAG